MISKTLCAALAMIASLLSAPLPARAGQQKSSANDQSPRIIKLWPKGAPGATVDSDEDTPAIIPYLPSSDKNTGAGVLICPGGAFTNRAVNHVGCSLMEPTRMPIRMLMRIKFHTCHKGDHNEKTRWCS